MRRKGKLQPSDDASEMGGEERWRAAVHKRVAQRRRLARSLEPGRSAGDSHAATRRSPVTILATAPPWWLPAGESLEFADRDPLFREIHRVAGPAARLLDLGAGTGRLTLRLALEHRRIIAVDESADSLYELQSNAAQLDLGAVSTVQGRWPDVAANVGEADIVFASYVLPLVEDVVPFIRAMTAIAHERCLVQMAAMPPDALFDPLWTAFHSAPREPGASYLDLMLLLQSMDLKPDVQVSTVLVNCSFGSLEEAVAEVAQYLILPRFQQESLAQILNSWLILDEGRLRPPLNSYPSAVVSWSARKDGGPMQR